MTYFVPYADHVTLVPSSEGEEGQRRWIVFIIDDGYYASEELLRAILEPGARLEGNDNWRYQELLEWSQSWFNTNLRVALAPWALLENENIRKVYSGGFILRQQNFWATQILDTEGVSREDAVFLVDHYIGQDTGDAALSSVKALIEFGVSPNRIFSYSISPRPAIKQEMEKLGVPPGNHFLRKSYLADKPIEAWQKVTSLIAG